jgi:hypothetical protein
MSLLDRVRLCQRRDLSHFRRFRIGESQLGWVRHDFAHHLARFPEAFEVDGEGVRLAPRLGDFESRSRAVDGVLRRLADEGVVTGWRGEDYPVGLAWDAPPLMKVERAGVAKLGVRAYGVHMNGYVGGGAEMKLWIGRRSMTKPTAPGKLDHLVAGGQPMGISPFDNLIKECREEADLPEAVARRARPVGFVSYLMENEEGMRNDILFAYDLEVPPDFEPRNTDGEIDGFQLWPIGRVVEVLAETESFKFNVALVIIDFLVRHGLLTPEDRDYLEIVRGLRSQPDD